MWWDIIGKDPNIIADLNSKCESLQISYNFKWSELNQSDQN